MFEVIHRDDNLLVLNKPADVSVLADRSGAPCLWDGLEAFLMQKPYLVHRLDKPTSGVLLVALNPGTQSRLTRAFQARQVRKFYLAWVTGDPGAAGLIDLPLKKGRKSRYRVAGPRESIIERSRRWTLGADTADGHPSLTRFRTLRREAERPLLLLASGHRFHQQGLVETSACQLTILCWPTCFPLRRRPAPPDLLRRPPGCRRKFRPGPRSVRNP